MGFCFHLFICFNKQKKRKTTAEFSGSASGHFSTSTDLCLGFNLLQLPAVKQINRIYSSHSML